VTDFISAHVATKISGCADLTVSRIDQTTIRASELGVHTVCIVSSVPFPAKQDMISTLSPLTLYHTWRDIASHRFFNSTYLTVGAEALW
jgi:hypothetical protein